MMCASVSVAFLKEVIRERREGERGGEKKIRVRIVRRATIAESKSKLFYIVTKFNKRKREGRGKRSDRSSGCSVALWTIKLLYYYY